MPNHRINTTYTGDLTDTIYIGPGGGAVAFTFVDAPLRTISSGVITIPSTVDTVALAVYPNISTDAFERRGGLSGELVMQKMMQVASGDEEEYMEDVINAGWNFPRLFLMVEKMDRRLLRLERPEI